VDELRRDEPDDQGDRYESKVAPTAGGACDRKGGCGGIRGRDSQPIG
jgi:hypothetical protein